MSRTRIESLSEAEKARMAEWADKWIAIGLKTDPADRPRFEEAARACYRFASLPEPQQVVWVKNPIVGAFAAPIATLLLAGKTAKTPFFSTRLHEAIGTVCPDPFVDDVSNAVLSVLGDDTPTIPQTDALRQAVQQNWHTYIGGQFWVGGAWYWGSAYTSFFREVCGLELPGDLWDRAKVYEATCGSACWWWPTTTFIMACDRPHTISLELTDPNVPRGPNSHRLHCDNGPALAWNGWTVYAVHGVRVPEQVVMDPNSLTPQQITAEPNAEVRRIMLARYGEQRYLREIDAKVLDNDPRWGILRQAELSDDEPLTMVTVLNSTAEPDGTRKPYTLRVPPTTRTAREAVSWTFGMKPEEYEPTTET